MEYRHDKIAVDERNAEGGVEIIIYYAKIVLQPGALSTRAG